MFSYFQLLILSLFDILSLNSKAISESDFTNSSFTGVFLAIYWTNDIIKKIRTITSEMCFLVECFIDTFKYKWIT